MMKLSSLGRPASHIQIRRKSATRDESDHSILAAALVQAHPHIVVLGVGHYSHEFIDAAVAGPQWPLVSSGPSCNLFINLIIGSAQKIEVIALPLVDPDAAIIPDHAPEVVMDVTHLLGRPGSHVGNGRNGNSHLITIGCNRECHGILKLVSAVAQMQRHESTRAQLQFLDDARHYIHMPLTMGGSMPMSNDARTPLVDACFRLIQLKNSNNEVTHV